MFKCTLAKRRASKKVTLIEIRAAFARIYHEG